MSRTGQSLTHAVQQTAFCRGFPAAISNSLEWDLDNAAQAFPCEQEVDRAAETPFRRTGQQAWASEAELLI